MQHRSVDFEDLPLFFYFLLGCFLVTLKKLMGNRRRKPSGVKNLPLVLAWQSFPMDEVSNIISNTRKSVSSGYPNTEKCVETTSRCLDILTKHSSECLIIIASQSLL